MARVLTVSGLVDDPNPADVTCNNDVAVASTNGAIGQHAAETACTSKNVRMVKDTDGNTDEASENANLFLCTQRYAVHRQRHGPPRR